MKSFTFIFFSVQLIKIQQSHKNHLKEILHNPTKKVVMIIITQMCIIRIITFS